jgi:DNA-binding NarL/FixJ family response regulator
MSGATLTAERREHILARYREHVDRFERLANPRGYTPLSLGTSADGETTKPSERELEVLQLIADGRSNAEIAKQLVVLVETVKSHVRQILRKLGATSRAHAVGIGLRAELVR